MKKPAKKKEVAIISVMEMAKAVILCATPEAINHFREFGSTYRNIPDKRDDYTLFVDARYDFDEVVQYIESYGSEKSELVLIVREEEAK